MKSAGHWRSRPNEKKRNTSWLDWNNFLGGLQAQKNREKKRNKETENKEIKKERNEEKKKGKQETTKIKKKKKRIDSPKRPSHVAARSSSCPISSKNFKDKFRRLDDLEFPSGDICSQKSSVILWIVFYNRLGRNKSGFRQENRRRLSHRS